MLKMPSDDAIDMACAWLDVNEGEGRESESCKAVRDWLFEQQTERKLRNAAKEAGVPLSKLRARLRQMDRSPALALFVAIAALALASLPATAGPGSAKCHSHAGYTHCH